MGKRIYLIIIYSVTTLCMLIGLYANVLRPVYNLSFRVFDKVFGSLEGGTTASDTIALDAFSNLKADVSIGDITVEQGDAYMVSYSCTNVSEPKFEVTDGTLTITQKKTGNRWKQLTKNHCKITLTIPEDAEFDSFQINADVGDLTISNITAKESDVTLNVGDLDIDDSYLGKAEIELNIGDLDLKNCELLKSEVRSNIGDVKLTNCTTEELSVTLDIGDLGLTLTRPESAYSLDASIDVGEITVDGRKCGTKYSTEDGEYQLKLDGNVGEITLKFGT